MARVSQQLCLLRWRGDELEWTSSMKDLHSARRRSPAAMYLYPRGFPAACSKGGNTSQLMVSGRSRFTESGSPASVMTFPRGSIMLASSCSVWSPLEYEYGTVPSVKISTVPLPYRTGILAVPLVQTCLSY